MRPSGRVLALLLVVPSCGPESIALSELEHGAIQLSSVLDERVPNARLLGAIELHLPAGTSVPLVGTDDDVELRLTHRGVELVFVSDGVSSVLLGRVLIGDDEQWNEARSGACLHGEIVDGKSPVLVLSRDGSDARLSTDSPMHSDLVADAYWPRIWAREGLPFDQHGVEDAVVVLGLPSAGSGGCVLVQSLAGDPVLAVEGADRGCQFGSSVCALGDISGDGVTELAIGAPGRSVFQGGGFDRESGKLHVVSGRDGETLRIIEGAADRDQFGESIATIGDVDRDGRADLVVAAPYNQYYTSPGANRGQRVAGYVSVVSMASGHELYRIFGDDRRAAIGSVVASLGDVDGDGVDDFFLGTESVVQDDGVVFGAVWSSLEKAPLLRVSAASVGRVVATAATVVRSCIGAPLLAVLVQLGEEREFTKRVIVFAL